jgi:hypothetical protein
MLYFIKKEAVFGSLAERKCGLGFHFGMGRRWSVLKLGVCCFLESFFNSAIPICGMRVKGKNSGPPLSPG